MREINFKLDDKSESAQLKKRVRYIFTALGAVVDSLRDDGQYIENMHLFKMRMTDIQEHIQNLKQNTKSNLEELKAEEKKLFEEVGYYNDKLPEWTQNVKIKLQQSQANHQAKNKAVEKSFTICKEAREYMNFVSASGHNDGWLEKDHQLFLKCRSKYKNFDKVAEKIRALLPDLTEDEIRHHDKWYQKFSELENKKKQAIRQWQEAAKIVKKIDQDSTEQKPVPKKTPPVKNDDNLKQELLKWKEEKAEKQRQQKKLEKLQGQARRQAEQQQKERQEEMRTIIDEWRRRRRLNLEMRNLEHEAIEKDQRKKKMREIRKMIKEFQKRDSTYVVRKIETLKKKEAQQSENAVTKPNKLFMNVPGKLLEPTEQWLRRTALNQSCDELNLKTLSGFMPTNYVMQIPKLHVPAWRKDVNTY